MALIVYIMDNIIITLEPINYATLIIFQSVLGLFIMHSNHKSKQAMLILSHYRTN